MPDQRMGKPLVKSAARGSLVDGMKHYMGRENDEL
jgi:hypothetical protein